MRNNQLKTGIRIESEHKGTIKFIKGYVKKHNKFPSDRAVYSKIASDHLKEDRKYYSKLKKLNL